MRASKEIVKKKFTHHGKSVTGWDAAITDAEKMIEEEKKKIARLRRSIRAFIELRDSGQPFPGESVTPSEAKGRNSVTPGETSQ